jgi:hypothetical protein
MKKIITGNYRSYNNLVSVIHSYIQSDLQPILKQVGEEIKKILHNFIQTNWYNSRPTPAFYDRTYETINSLTVDQVRTTGNRTEVLIYFDNSKIGSYQTDNGMWNQHMSIDGSSSWGGISIGQWVVDWMDKGQNSPAYSYGGIHFIDNILNNKDDFIKKINELLKSKGYICKVK